MDPIISFFSGLTPGGVGIWLGVGMFALYWVREFRETRKLSSEDRQARREGFQAMVENLQKENRGLQNDNRELRLEMHQDRINHAEYRKLCHAETDALRQQVAKLEDDVQGYRRRLDVQAIAMARIKGEGYLIEGEADASPATDGSAK